MAPGEVPAAAREVPAAPGEVPVAPGEVPAMPGEVPAAPGEVPAALGEVPAPPGEAASGVPAAATPAMAAPAVVVVPAVAVAVLTVAVPALAVATVAVQGAAPAAGVPGALSPLGAMEEAASLGARAPLPPPGVSSRTWAPAPPASGVAGASSSAWAPASPPPGVAGACSSAWAVPGAPGPGTGLTRGRGPRVGREAGEPGRTRQFLPGLPPPSHGSSACGSTFRSQPSPRLALQGASPGSGAPSGLGALPPTEGAPPPAAPSGTTAWPPPPGEGAGAPAPGGGVLPARVLAAVEEQVVEQGGQLLGGRVAGLPLLTPPTSPLKILQQKLNMKNIGTKSIHMSNIMVYLAMFSSIIDKILCFWVLIR